jgi:hypothetical protein
MLAAVQVRRMLHVAFGHACARAAHIDVHGLLIR